MNTVNNRPYHHGRLREELVRIAVELAAEGGPEAIVMREAARRAGVSPSAAYRHFSGQEELRGAVYKATSDALATCMEESIARLPGDATALDRLEAASEGYFTFAEEQQDLYRAFSRKQSDMPFVPERQAYGPFGLLCSLVSAARPEADDETVFALSVVLWSAVHGFAALCTTGILQQLPEEWKREMLPEIVAPALRSIADGAAREVATR
jgi:AcrR family transcriptional regulator